MKKTEHKPIVSRMPKQLVRLLDRAGKAAGRSRSAEIVHRLSASFAAVAAVQADGIPTLAPSVVAGSEVAQGAPAAAQAQVKKLRGVTHAV